MLAPNDQPDAATHLLQFVGNRRFATILAGDIPVIDSMSRSPQPTSRKATTLDAPRQASIASKLSRGTFPAGFFLAALVAIGAETIRLEDV